MKNNHDHKAIIDLWQEHLATPFPEGLLGEDMNGVDLVPLDADIAGCVTTFVERGKLDLYQTAVLGLSCQSASHVVPLLNEEGATYYRRLERLAELILKAVALDNEANHYR
jgi:hypothetical protein